MRFLRRLFTRSDHSRIRDTANVTFIPTESRDEALRLARAEMRQDPNNAWAEVGPTGSMQPTIPTGCVVVYDTTAKPADLQPGDIITGQDPVGTAIIKRYVPTRWGSNTYTVTGRSDRANRNGPSTFIIRTDKPGWGKVKTVYLPPE